MCSSDLIWFNLINLGLFLSLCFFSSCDDNKNDRIRLDFDHVEKTEFATNKIPVLRVAVSAMTSPKETFRFYEQMINYIGEKIGRKVQFIQRKTYKEVNDLLHEGKLDRSEEHTSELQSH